MQKISVVQENAQVGVLEETSDAALRVRLEDGQHALITRDELEPLADGSLLLKTPLEQLELEASPGDPSVLAAKTVAVAGNQGAVPSGEAPGSESLTIPLVEERLKLEKITRSIGSVRVHVVPSERVQTVSVPVAETHAEVRRVAIGRVVDTVPSVREEGTTVIIPVVEEVLVVEKRLLLREEIHVLRREETRIEEHQVSLRAERAEISRSDE